MKWGMQAFDTCKVVPPGFGIVHPVHLEWLARGVHRGRDGVACPDTLVGTDSHTTMINGVVGWGVGGIEAEAAMLGQPVYLLTPDVVGAFVEFCGQGRRSLAMPDRATIASMAPEHGATMGFLPVDDWTLDCFRGPGCSRAEGEAFEACFRAQGQFGVHEADAIDDTRVIRLDLGTVAPRLAGPSRPQDRIQTGQVEQASAEVFGEPPALEGSPVQHGDLVIAATTSCTNTSKARLKAAIP